MHQQIRARHQVEADRVDAFNGLLGEAMVVPEKVQGWPHRTQDFVDLRLAGIRPSASGIRPERLWRFVSHEDVYAAEPLARLDFVAHEVPALVGQFRRLGASPLWVRQIGGRRLVPRRREGAAEPGDDEADLGGPPYIRSQAGPLGPGDFGEGPIRNVMKIRRRIAGGDRVEVVVVAVDPVDRGAERFVTSVLVRDVADAQPERDLGMPRDDGPRGVERAVDVA